MRLFNKIHRLLFGWKIIRARVDQHTKCLIFSLKRYGKHREAVLTSTTNANGMYIPNDHDVQALNFFAQCNKDALGVSDCLDHTYEDELNHYADRIIDTITGDPVLLRADTNRVKLFTVQAYLIFVVLVVSGQRNKCMLKNDVTLNKTFVAGQRTPNAVIYVDTLGKLVHHLMFTFGDIENVKEFVNVYKLFKFRSVFRDKVSEYLVGFDGVGSDLRAKVNTRNIVHNTYESDYYELLDFTKDTPYRHYFRFHYLLLNDKVFSFTDRPRAREFMEGIK